MKFWIKFSTFIITVLMIMSFTVGCTNTVTEENENSDLLYVKSVYGDLALSPGIPFQLTDGWDDGSNRFARYCCYVGKTDNFLTDPSEKLVISHKPVYTDGDYDTRQNPCGYYSSYEYTDDGKKTDEKEWFGNENGIYYEGELLIQEEYAAFLPYHNKMAIITKADGRAHLWLCQMENGTWTLDPNPFVLGDTFKYNFPVASEPDVSYYFPFRNDGFSDPPDTLWIATKKSLLSVSLGEWLSYSNKTREIIQVTEHSVPDYWDKLHIANITQIEDTLYFGEHFGVLKADVFNEDITYTFYPVDYQSVLQEEK